MATTSTVDPQLRSDYVSDGYVVVPGVLDRSELDELIAEAVAIGQGRRGAVRGIATLPAEGGRDPDSAELAEESDDEVLARYLAIHFPHKVSQLIRDRYLAHPRFVDILSTCVGPNIKCMQSMLFTKPAGKPGQAWHQDEYFIPTRDRSLCGLWLAIDDATTDNGCLWVRPGSHADGIIYRTEAHGRPDEFDEGTQLTGTPDDEDPGVPVEVAAGDVVLFNGYLHHRSFSNRAEPGTFRRALVNHYMSAESMLPWDWDGRIPPTRDMRDIVMICGDDPYAHKGIDDITFGLLRPESDDPTDPNRDPAKRVF